MELAVRPDDLAAAAVALTGCSARLQDAIETFVQRAHSDLPDIGADTAEAARRGVTTATREAQVVSTDINQVTKALVALALGYHAIDRAAMPPR
jgi:hypothetical protein